MYSRGATVLLSHPRSNARGVNMCSKKWGRKHGLRVLPLVLVFFACDPSEDTEPPPPDPPPSRAAPDRFGPTNNLGALPGAVQVSLSGEATYSVPIEVPPGRMGMHPSLAISYASNDGMSTLGKGFGLSGLSAITRCARTPAVDGVRSPPRFDDSDAYCLDGSRLLYAGEESGRAVYRTERYSSLRVFATPGVNGPSTFEVNDGEGGTSFYGEPEYFANGAIEGDATVASWRISRSVDAFGNFMTFHYSQPTYAPAGPRGAIGESHIKEIHYTFHESGDTGQLVQFEYDEDPDGRMGFTHGFSFRRQRRLVRVSAFDRTGLAHAYKLKYDNGSPSGSSRLTSLNKCTSAPHTPDAILDDEGLVCLRATEFEWTTGDADTPFEEINTTWYLNRPDEFFATELGQTFQTPESSPVISLDANGDGAADLAFVTRVPDSTGTSFTNALGIRWGAPGDEPFRDVVHGTHSDAGLLEASLTGAGGKIHGLDIDHDGYDEIVALGAGHRLITPRGVSPV